METEGESEDAAEKVITVAVAQDAVPERLGDAEAE